MSVLINMDMPFACSVCRLETEDCRCSALYSVVDTPEFGKLKDCPLVPVPPHGRLIDADAAVKQGWTISRTYSASPNQMVYEVKAMTDEILPTIIPAEEGET